MFEVDLSSSNDRALLILVASDLGAGAADAADRLARGEVYRSVSSGRKVGREVAMTLTTTLS